jgi:hypothetical protein
MFTSTAPSVTVCFAGYRDGSSDNLSPWKYHARQERAVQQVSSTYRMMAALNPGKRPTAEDDAASVLTSWP